MVVGDRGDGQGRADARRPARGLRRGSDADRRTQLRRRPRGTCSVAARQGDDPHRLRPRPLPGAPASRRSPPRWRARRTSTTSPPASSPRSRSASPTPTASAARSRRRSRQSRATRRGARRLPLLADIRPGALVRDAAGDARRGERRAAGSAPAGPSSTTRASRSSSTSRSSARRISTSPSPSVTDTGVSPVLFYDPVERVVATLHPNHTYEKVVFDPWHQTTYDVNDTVAATAAPDRRPAHRSGRRRLRRAVLRDRAAHGWETWHAQRIGGAAGTAEPTPRTKAEAHADTPTRRAPRRARPPVPDRRPQPVRAERRPSSRSATRHAGRARHRGQPARGP